MKRCLVTGATGLIGSHLIPKLKDWEVHIISHRKLPNTESENDIHHININFSEEWSTDELPESVDAIIHLAQSEHYREFPTFADHVFAVNTISTVRLLNYAKRCKVSTFILASSGGVYGSGEKEFSEDKPLYSRDDLGFYLGTKFCSEILAENYSEFMTVATLRFFFVYGPGQNANMLIPRLVQSVKEGKAITLQGENGIKINPIYVTDAVEAIINTLALKESDKINIAGSEPMSLRTISEIIGRHMDKDPLFEISANTEAKHLVGDIGKMRNLLGSPTTKFDEGIRRCINSL